MAQTLDQAHKQTPAHSAATLYVYQLSLVCHMAKLSVRSSSKKKGSSGGGLVKLKLVVQKLPRSLLMGRNKSSSNFDKYDEGYVPEDVKEGHFAVIGEDGEEPKRFVMPLSCLSNPTFLRLLEQAAEEYGFDHEGALTIPCRPSELERILLEQQWQQEEAGSHKLLN